MIGVIDVECQAFNPNMPLHPMRAFAGSPSSIRVRNVPKRIGDWCIRSVYLNAIYPDGTIKSASCVLTGGIWVGTIEGTSTTGTSMNGYTIFADGTDENGNTVTGYVLGKGDIYILDSNGQLNPDAARYVVRMLSAESASPLEGDFWPVNGTWYIWQSGEAKQVGVSREDVDAMISSKADLSALEEVENSLSDYALSSQIPLSVSQLENDSGYITSTQVEPLDRPLTSGYAKKSWNATLLDAWGTDNLPSENYYAQAYANYNTATDSWNFDIKCQCYVFAWFNLEKLFEETFLPAIKLKWRYQTIWRNRAGRWSKTYTGWMWLAAGQYAITASEDGTPNGKFYVLYSADETHQNCINDSATDVHTVEFVQVGYLISISTIDGQENQITCYRSDGYSLAYVRDVAFEDELSSKADLSALDNYLPLSGDATANVVTNLLYTNAVINGDPNTSGTIGPDEGGDHYNGVLISDGAIDIQKSKASGTVDWYGTKIEGDGRITLKEKDGSDPVITYDELKLPKTQSHSTRTIATREWVLEQLSALETRIAALEGN